MGIFMQIIPILFEIAGFSFFISNIFIISYSSLQLLRRNKITQPLLVWFLLKQTNASLNSYYRALGNGLVTDASIRQVLAWGG